MSNKSLCVYVYIHYLSFIKKDLALLCVIYSDILNSIPSLFFTFY